MTQGLYLVVDNDFNRANYSDEIGNLYEIPPSYVQVSTERKELDRMNDRELVAYWNILQLTVKITDAPKPARHLMIVDELLLKRQIPHKHGRTISVRKAA